MNTATDFNFFPDFIVNNHADCSILVHVAKTVHIFLQEALCFQDKRIGIISWAKAPALYVTMSQEAVAVVHF